MGRPTMAALWARLEPHAAAFGPDDETQRPAVLLFHGCGGVREHLAAYAEAASAAGVRAFVVDSYAPRGWSHGYALSAVCTGVRFWGRERAGDVLAAAWGVSRRADVDASRLALAGWSHGAWAVMDLMTMALERTGEAALVDPNPAPLAGLRALFLAYPYGGFGALSRRRRWRRSPEVLGIIPARDHVTGRGDALRLYATARAGGSKTEIWEMKAGTHSFDETTGVPPMRHHPEMAAEARKRFAEFLQKTLQP